MLADPPILTTIPGSAVPVAIGPGRLESLGELANALLTSPLPSPLSLHPSVHHALFVTDPGLLATPHVARALASLARATIPTTIFSNVGENPTADHVAAGAAVAREHAITFFIALGGGSAIDAAKGINFLYTNGGTIRDYRGYAKATRPLLPLIAIPTTAGTGSEAQSYALITDPATHEKMACGDPTALPRLALLDPDLLDTCPPRVLAATALDALAHAIESSASTKRNATSRPLSRQAYALLTTAIPEVFPQSKIPNQKSKIQDLLLGAHLAGAAIENSMLGAAHAAANPLTARFAITHGLAVALMLPHVVRFNTQSANPYADLDPHPAHLLQLLDDLLTRAGLPRSLQNFAIPRTALPDLAAQAAKQWTAAFNPRPMSRADFVILYEQAWRA